VHHPTVHDASEPNGGHWNRLTAMAQAVPAAALDGGFPVESRREELKGTLTVMPPRVRAGSLQRVAVRICWQACGYDVNG
jgi:hypothetical protein